MLTIVPIKRYSLVNVTQHRWFNCKMPQHIKNLLQNLSNQTDLNIKIPATILTFQIDPTVLLFMQQHTGWTESEIMEVFFNIFY